MKIFLMKNFDRAKVHQDILIERGVGGGSFGLEKHENRGHKESQNASIWYAGKGENREENEMCVVFELLLLRVWDELGR